MSQGRSLRLFLVDGTPNGLLTAEIMNWTDAELDDAVRRAFRCARSNQFATQCVTNWARSHSSRFVDCRQ